MVALDSVLKEQYYDVEKPGSFSSASKLYHIINANEKKGGYYKIKRWLNSQDSYSLQKTPRRNFKRLRMYTTGLSNLWEADLMEVQNIASENNGYRYILVVINVFSKFVWLQTLKTKTGAEVATKFRIILETANTLPEKIRTDKDRCFISKAMQQVFREKNIHHYVTQNETKACVVERVNQTLRNKLFRYFNAKRTHKYIDVLQKIADSYNATPHRSLGYIAPKDVTPENEADVWAYQYLRRPKVRERKIKSENVCKSEKKQKRKVYRFKIGCLVRISHIRQIFDRSYHHRWTEEVFKVIQRFRKQNINLYKLSDINGDETIKGDFYESELQRVDKDENSLWVIEKIIKRRKRRGVTECLVKFQGFPSKFNQYIPERDIKTLS